MKFNNKPFIYILISSLIFTVGFLSVVVWYVNYLSQKEKVTTFIIQKQIQRLLDLDSEVENPRAYIDWDLQYKIKADKLVFKEHDGNPLVSVNDIRVNVFIPMLLLRKIYLTKMEGKDFYVNFERYPDKKINIIEIFNITGFFKIYFRNSTISIHNYIFDFTDRMYLPNKFMTVRGNDLLVTKFSHKKYLQMTTEGNLLYDGNSIPYFINSDLKMKNQKNDYNISLEASDVYFNSFFDYGKEIYPDLTKLDGSGNIKAKISSGKYFNIDADINKFNFGNKRFPNLLAYSKPFNFNSRFSYENKTFLIDEANLISDKFDVSAKGRVYDFFNKEKRKVNVFVEIKNNSSAKELLKITPNGLPVLRGSIDRAKKYDIEGSVNGEMQIDFPYMTGIVDVTNSKFILEKAIVTGNSYLNFDRDTFSLNSRLFTSTNDYVDVSGKVKFVHPVVLDLHAVSSKNMHLVQSCDALNMASDIFDFSTGPIPLLNIKDGVGSLDLAIKGTPPLVFLNGNFKSYGVRLSYPGFYGEVEKGSGEVIFNGDSIVFNNFKGQQNGILASAYGETKIHQEGLTHFYLDIDKIPMKISKIFIDNSPLLKEVSKGLEFISKPDGYGSLFLTLKFQKGLEIPDAKGKFTLLGVDGNIKDLAYRAKNVTGVVDFDNDVVSFNVNGFLNDLETQVIGTAKRNFAQINIINTDADIKKAYELIHKSPMFAKIKDAFNDFRDFSGKIDSNIKISGNFLTQEIASYTSIDIIEGRLKYLDINEFINISGGKILANDTGLIMDNVTGNVFNSNFKLNGDVSNFGLANEKSNINFDVKNVDIKNISKIIGTELLTPEVSELLSKISFLGGSIDIYSEVKNKIPETTISFYDVLLKYLPTNDLITANSGRMFFSEETIGFDNIDIDVKNSSCVATGNIKNYNSKNPIFDLNLSANIEGKDFYSTFKNIKDFPLSLIGRIYLNADFVGNLENWNLKMRSMLEQGANICYKGANLGDSISRFIFTDLSKVDNDLIINKAELFASSQEMLKDDNKAVMEAQGRIINVNSQIPTFENLVVKFNDLVNISLINILIKESNNENPFISEGKMKGKIFVNGQLPDVNLLGDIYIQNAFIPSINTKIDNMFLLFKPDVIEIPNSDITIVNSKAQIKGSILNKLTSPLEITELEINSKNINYDEIVRSFSQTFKSTSKDVNIEKIPLPPIVIENGKLSTDEFIYEGLLCKDLKADISVSKDWFCNINNLQMGVTTGKMEGDLAYNFYTTDMYGTIEAKNVLANAIATTFFNLPNEIYGDLSGVVSFTTRGLTNEEIFKNLSGSADFNLLDGRMIRMGSVEYMLKLANMLKGGFSTLNLNALVNIVAPKTGFFDSIDGEIQIQNGIITTDKITFSSKELELFLTGAYDINNSNVNGTIIGQIPKEAKDSVITLGFIGEISLNSLKRRVTRQLKKEEDVFLFNPLSYLGSISYLNKSAENYRFFLVILEGNLYKGNYVKSFKWIKTK